jgi:putative transcriptional regulator
MKEKSFSKLLASIKEAGQIRADRKRPGRIFSIDPSSIKAVRRKLHLSQSEFALMIGVSTSTLQNWEQGRREPDGPAKALLKVASQNPEAVMDALHS